MHNFDHNFLPKLQLERIDSPEGRKYITPENNSYQSVTTFLGKIGKEELDEWRKNVGEEEAGKISKRASRRGTVLHTNVEQFLLNKEVNISSTDLVSKSLFKPFSNILIKNVNNIKALEYPVYSDALKLAGTLDLIADWNKTPSIIDFKTSNKLKEKYEIENYFLQTSIYSYMVEERYKIKIPQLVILIGIEFYGTVQVFVEDRSNYHKKIIKLLRA